MKELLILVAVAGAAYVVYTRARGTPCVGCAKARGVLNYLLRSGPNDTYAQAQAATARVELERPIQLD